MIEVIPKEETTCQDDTISRRATLDALLQRHKYCIDPFDSYHIDITEAETRISQLPSAQPTEASCWGCNCPKMERLKEQKTFSEIS